MGSSFFAAASGEAYQQPSLRGICISFFLMAGELQAPCLKKSKDFAKQVLILTEASSKGLRDCSQADGEADTAQIIQPPTAATLEPPPCGACVFGCEVPTRRPIRRRRLLLQGVFRELSPGGRRSRHRTNKPIVPLGSMATAFSLEGAGRKIGSKLSTCSPQRLGAEGRGRMPPRVRQISP